MLTVIVINRINKHFFPFLDNLVTLLTSKYAKFLVEKFIEYGYELIYHIKYLNINYAVVIIQLLAYYLI